MEKCVRRILTGIHTRTRGELECDGHLHGRGTGTDSACRFQCRLGSCAVEPYCPDRNFPGARRVCSGIPETVEYSDGTGGTAWNRYLSLPAGAARSAAGTPALEKTSGMRRNAGYLLRHQRKSCGYDSHVHVHASDTEISAMRSGGTGAETPASCRRDPDYRFGISFALLRTGRTDGSRRRPPEIHFGGLPALS